MSRYILAHDLGTSGNKATLFHEDGTMAGSNVYNYGTDYFNTNWVEQDANDWWRAVCETSKKLLADTGVLPSDVAAVSFSGQMMGCLPVDKDANPLRKSIIWADLRAQAQAAQIAESIPLRDFYGIVGHRNSESYGIQKLLWIRDNEPEIYANTYKMLNAKDFIIAKLTGKFYTDYSDGTGNGCIDLKALKWSERIIDAAGIDGDKLPELKPSTFVAGGITAEASRETGLAEGTPVVMGAGDGVAANVGAGSVAPGRTFSYVGSSAWIATTSEQPLFDEGMRTVTWAHAVEGWYAPNGTMQCAGGAYSWARSRMSPQESYDEINARASQSPVGAGGVTFLPYLLGERAPRWNPNAKGAFVGLKMESTNADMMRAVLEGVTMNLALILDVFRQSLKIDDILVIGGGAKGELWRQIMADIYRANIHVPELLEEATSMGAAVIGGVGAGLFKNFTAIDRFISIKSVQQPDERRAKDYEPVREMYERVYAALEPVF